MKIRLKVSTCCKHSQILYMWKDKFGVDLYKVNVKSKPIDWQANKEIIKLLSEYFQYKKNNIRIIAGENSSNKLCEISSKFF